MRQNAKLKKAEEELYSAVSQMEAEVTLSKKTIEALKNQILGLCGAAIKY